MQLDFTRDGRFLISVGLDDSHTAGATLLTCSHVSHATTNPRSLVAVLYDWRAGVPLCQANAHMSDVHVCRFNPYVRPCLPTVQFCNILRRYSPGNEFVSTGNKHVKVSVCCIGGSG